MRINLRLGLGFLTCMTLTCAVGVTGWFSLNIYAREVAETTRLARIAEDLNQSAAAIARYQRHGDRVELEVARNGAERLTSSLAATAPGPPGAGPTTDPREAHTLIAMHQAVEGYRSALARFAGSVAASEERVEEMVQVKRELDRIAEEISTLNMRRHQEAAEALAAADTERRNRMAVRDLVVELIESTLRARLAETSYRFTAETSARDQAMDQMKAMYLAGVSLRKITAGTLDEQAVTELTKAVSTYRKELGEQAKAVERGEPTAELAARLGETSLQISSLAEAIAEQQVAAYEAAIVHAASASARVVRAVEDQIRALRINVAARDLALAEAAYLEQPSPETAKAVRALIEGTTAAFNAFGASGQDPDQGERVAELGSQLDRYVAAFNAVEQVLDDREHAENRMNDLQADVIAMTEERQAAARQRMDDQFRFGIWLIGAFSLVALVLGTALAWLIGASISRPLRAMSASIARLAKGDPTAVIPALDRKDELGDMARSMGVIRETGAAAQRARKTLDSAGVCVMMIAPDGTVAYGNAAMEAFCREVGGGLGKELPGFAADTVEGQPFSAFHREAALDPTALLEMKGRTDHRLQVAGKTLHVRLDPIFDESGARIGTVGEWTDQTARLQMEQDVQAVIAAAAAGDFERRIDIRGLEGFLLTISTGVNQLMAAVDAAVKDAASVMAALAEGDLRCSMAAHHAGVFARLQRDSQKMADQLAAIVGGIAHVTARLKHAAEDISLGATDLARRTESQATFVEQTSKAMANLSSIVDVSTGRAHDANAVARDACQAARSSEARVRDAVDAMGRIQASSEQVTHIIGIIDEIAFQTNLLALNAAVEAARAGEAGRGFAVVATEVRTLAQRAADASHKISVLIGSAVEEVGSGVALVRGVGEDLEAIVASVKSFAELIGGIVAGNKEQSGRLQNVAEALRAMDEVTKQNRVLVEQTGAAVEAQVQQVDELHRMVRFFKTREALPARLPAGKDVLLAEV